MASAPSTKPHRIVSITVDPSVKHTAIEQILEKLYAEAGCRACGLNGFDVWLHAVDPAVQVKVPSLQEGVLGMSTAVAAQR